VIHLDLQIRVFNDCKIVGRGRLVLPISTPPAACRFDPASGAFAGLRRDLVH